MKLCRVRIVLLTRKACCLLVVDKHVVTAMKLIAKGGIAAALKLQKLGAMLFLPGGDVGIGSCIETLALAGHARVVMSISYIDIIMSIIIIIDIIMSVLLTAGASSF